jgi:2-polyprenyl-6-methoxyphenol hydroxylase-like FAD-dependent oxidoreductase
VARQLRRGARFRPQRHRPQRPRGRLAVGRLPGGHSIFYLIPDFDGGTTPGRRRVNWGIYAPKPDGLDFAEPGSLPPGAIDKALYAHLDRLLDEHFPPAVAALFRLSSRDEVSLQPIYDEVIERYAGRRLALIGDAGALGRPHTGSGATKALQDALAFERLAETLGSWEEVLAAYDAERVKASNALVELGRRIGRAQVEQTPDWPSMTEADFEAWSEATFAGSQLYFYDRPAKAEAAT